MPGGHESCARRTRSRPSPVPQDERHRVSARVDCFVRRAYGDDQDAGTRVVPRPASRRNSVIAIPLCARGASIDLCDAPAQRRVCVALGTLGADAAARVLARPLARTLCQRQAHRNGRTRSGPSCALILSTARRAGRFRTGGARDNGASAPVANGRALRRKRHESCARRRLACWPAPRYRLAGRRSGILDVVTQEKERRRPAPDRDRLELPSRGEVVSS